MPQVHASPAAAGTQLTMQRAQQVTRTWRRQADRQVENWFHKIHRLWFFSNTTFGFILAGGKRGEPTMNASAYPVDTAAMPWIDLRPGVAFRPVRFGDDGWTLQLRVEPGTTIARHRHSGEVHAFNISGSRELIETGEIVGPGFYVYEPPGNTDSWRCVGDQPCIVQINLTGRVEYLDDEGKVLSVADTHTQREVYLAWCREHGIDARRLMPALSA
jgi:2,4'-dihydroxyacetophenone dioxygenase